MSNDTIVTDVRLRSRFILVAFQFTRYYKNNSVNDFFDKIEMLKNKKARKHCALRAFTFERNHLCRPSCSIFEHVYDGAKAIDRHCCLAISACGSFIFKPFTLIKMQIEKLTKTIWNWFSPLSGKWCY